jgi:hypothetical protein
MRISLRAVLIALVALVAIGGLVTTGVLGTVPEERKSLTTSSEGFCTVDGVSLLIDFGTSSNEKTVVTCAADFVGTGWDLFAATKQAVEGTSEYPVGFVCRINNFPAEQPCSSTPTSTEGTWAYYYASADLGNNWKFSIAGASLRKPLCGDVDAWVFVNSGEESHEPELAPQTKKCPK